MAPPRVWLLCLLLLGLPVRAADLHSYALVQDDGSLLIKNRVVHLYGIWLPETERQCRTVIRPVRCASRAVLALEFKIQGFVHCEPRRERPDGSLEALCRVGRTGFDPGEDLAAYLLEQGWALALPDAPFEYLSLERLARHQGRGLWGYPADSFSR
jgi:endonuclease YncB( thermonuclease family)